MGVHNQLGEEQGGCGAEEAIASGEKVAQDTSNTGCDDVPGCQPSMLIGSERKRRTGGPERIEDNNQQQNNGQQAATGRGRGHRSSDAGTMA